MPFGKGDLLVMIMLKKVDTKRSWFLISVHIAAQFIVEQLNIHLFINVFPLRDVIRCNLNSQLSKSSNFRLCLTCNLFGFFCGNLQIPACLDSLG